MRKIAIVGAGKIGSMIAEMLSSCGSYAVSVLDRDPVQLARLHVSGPIARTAVDIADAAARTAARPGFITGGASDLIGRFDSLLDVRMRVGALPQFPVGPLGYNLTWSTDGVINEYCEPCEAIVDGHLRHTLPLEEVEAFALDGVQYEAFNTSGGLGSLCETLSGRVRNLNYRTIRYPGHAAIMRVLLHDLGLRDRRALLKDILETAIPATTQDVVIVFVSVTGQSGGRLMQHSYARHIRAAEMGGVMRSAIQITTASGICAVLDLLAEGRLPQHGFVRQEQVALPDFLANRFGRNYADPDADLAPPAARHAA